MEENVPGVKRERQKIGNDPNRIMAIKDEIACVDHAAQQANLPKTGGNNAFLRSFRSDPLPKKAKTKDQVSGPANDLPGIHLHRGEL